MDEIKVKGFVTYTLRDKYGKIKDKRVDVPNFLTNAGLAAIASLIATDNPGSETSFDYIAIGISSGQSAASTTLASEITTNGGERGTVTGTSQTTTVTDDTIVFTTTFTFTGSFAVTESGVFNASSAGTMLSYQDFTAINVVSGDTLTMEWKIKFA